MMKKHFGIALVIAVLIAVGWLFPACVNTNDDLADRVAVLEREVESLKETYPCRIYLNHPQTVPCGVPTVIELDAVTYDPNGCFDPADHSYRVQKEGWHLVVGTVWLDIGLEDGTVVSAQVLKNDEIIIESDDMCAHPNIKDVQPHCIDVVYLMPGDRVRLRAVYYSGGPCELKFVERQNYLTVFKL